ncbi:MAG: hypothetical protein MI755_10190 [Sphingomonadales bacterium]|nr:hypothetical protein [Sphingomonadales bacterium]
MELAELKPILPGRDNAKGYAVLFPKESVQLMGLEIGLFAIKAERAGMGGRDFHPGFSLCRSDRRMRDGGDGNVSAAILPLFCHQDDNARPVFGAVNPPAPLFVLPQEITTYDQTYPWFNAHGLVFKQVIQFGRWLALVAFLKKFVAQLMRISGTARILEGLQPFILLDVEQNPRGPGMAGNDDRRLRGLFQIPASLVSELRRRDILGFPHHANP